MLRVVLIGATAVLAYAILSALDNAPADADDGATGRRAGGGALMATLMRPDAARPVAEASRALVAGAAATLPTSVAADRAGPAVGRLGPARRAGTGPRGDAEAAGPAAGSAPPRPVADRVLNTLRNLTDPVGPTRPAPDPRPGDSSEPIGPTPNTVGPGAVVPGVVPAVVGAVPVVVGTVPAAVGSLPVVVEAVSGLLGVVPVVVRLVPDRAPDVVQVIPDAIDVLPGLLLPNGPPPSLAPIRLSLAVVTGMPSGSPAGPTARTVPTAGAGVPGEARFASSHRSTVTPRPVTRDATEDDPAPENPPVTGAQQAAGAGAGSGHPHTVSAASAAPVAYRVIFTARGEDTDGVGSSPGVAALPG